MSFELADEVAPGKISLLRQKHIQAAPGRISGNPGAVDASADDDEIEHGVAHSCSLLNGKAATPLPMPLIHGIVAGRR